MGTSAEVKTRENQEAQERAEESRPFDGSQNTSVQGTTSQAKTHCRARSLTEAPENSNSKTASLRIHGMPTGRRLGIRRSRVDAPCRLTKDTSPHTMMKLCLTLLLKMK